MENFDHAKGFTAIPSLVAKFLNFVLKLFLVCLVSILESWRKKHQFYISSVQKWYKDKEAPMFPNWCFQIKTHKGTQSVLYSIYSLIFLPEATTCIHAFLSLMKTHGIVFVFFSFWRFAEKIAVFCHDWGVVCKMQF